MAIADRYVKIIYMNRIESGWGFADPIESRSSGSFPRSFWKMIFHSITSTANAAAQGRPQSGSSERFAPCPEIESTATGVSIILCVRGFVIHTYDNRKPNKSKGAYRMNGSIDHKHDDFFFDKEVRFLALAIFAFVLLFFAAVVIISNLLFLPDSAYTRSCSPVRSYLHPAALGLF
jgi:hypothetical protein